MIIFRENINDSELIIWRIDETLSELMEISNHHYDHELDGISNETRKKERLISRYLLEILIGRKVEIRYEESGKPICNGINFSISHTKNYVVVILGRNNVVGVDIEYKSDRIFRVTENFMHIDELKTLSETTEKQKFALICWCAKETVFKMIDETGVDFTEMCCKVSSDNIILSYKNTDFTLNYMEFPDFFVIFS